MRAGELRHVVTIKRKVVTQDTYNQEVITWTTVATLRAKIETASGAEYTDVETAGASLAQQVTIRHYPGLAPTMRVYWGARVFEIEAVQEDNLNRATMLMCSEVISE